MRQRQDTAVGWAEQHSTTTLLLRRFCFKCTLSPADCDVYFRQQMKLFDWGTPLPTALGLG